MIENNPFLGAMLAGLYDLSLNGESVTFDLDSYKLVARALLGAERRNRRLIELPAIEPPQIHWPEQE